MDTISSLAFVHPEATLGENVIIEPFAYIDGNVEIGDGSRIMSHAVILAGARIGKNCTVFPHATVSGIPQDLKFMGEESQAIIGDGTVIRECVTVNRGTASKGFSSVGKGCLLMAYSHVAHDCVIKDHVILGNASQLAGEVEIDDFAILSGGTLVHQFTKIGKHVMIQGGTRLGKDIPPFAMAGREPVIYAGINIVGLRRRKFSTEQINSIQDVYRLLYQSGLNTTQALGKIENDLPASDEKNEILEFIRNSTRGIVRGGIDG